MNLITSEKNNLSFREFSNNKNEWIDRTTKSIDISLIKNKYQKQLVELNKITSCIICGAVYKPSHNFLLRSCMIHKAHFSMNSNPPSHPCCGGSDGSQGCVHAMHVSRLESHYQMLDDPYKHIILIPKELIDNNLIDIAYEYIDKSQTKKYPNHYPIKTVNLK